MNVRRILAVVDFSKPSQPAITYAASLAQSLHATLTLAAISSASSVTENAELIDQLIVQCKKTSFAHNIACSFDSRLTGVAKSDLVQCASAYQLVIIGMHGVTDYIDFFNDCTVLASLTRMTSQVVLIPALHRYAPITRITYCFELNKGETLVINSLLQLALALKCKIHLLQLVHDKFSRGLETAISRQQEETRELHHNEMQLEFKTIWTTEFTGSTNYFMHNVKADALALSGQHLSLLKEMFRIEVSKEITSITRHPLILFNY